MHTLRIIKTLDKKIKITYKSVIKSVVVCGSKAWVLTNKVNSIFGKKNIKNNYRPINTKRKIQS